MILSTIVFTVFSLGGYLSAQWFDISGLERSLRLTFEPFASLSPTFLFAAIFSNNVVTTFLFMLLGIIFGIAPLLFLLINGLVLGFVVYLTGSALVAIAGIMPHGIIEIPAIILAASLGLFLGTTLWRKVRRRDVDIVCKLRVAMKTYFSIVIPALLVSAALESFLTPFAISAAVG